MASRKKRSRPPADPAADDPAAALPSERDKRAVTVKLDMADRRILGRCRRLLSGPEGDRYPTVSRTLRLALGALYHSLTGHPPAEVNHEQQP